MPFNNSSRWQDGAASRLIVIQAFLRKNLVESEFEDVAIAYNYEMHQPITKRTAKMCRDKWDQIGSGHSTGHSSRSPEQMDVEKINQIRDEEKQTKSPLTTEQLASLKEISNNTSFNIFSPCLRYFENVDGSNPNAAHASDDSVVVARYRNTNARAMFGVSCLLLNELLFRGAPEVIPILCHFTVNGLSN